MSSPTSALPKSPSGSISSTPGSSVVSTSGPKRPSPLARIGSALSSLVRHATLGPPLEGWSLAETLLLGDLRRLMGGTMMKGDIEKQRRGMEGFARPCPPEASVSHIRIPRRVDLFRPASEQPPASDASNPEPETVLCEVVEWNAIPKDQQKEGAAAQPAPATEEERPICMWIHGGAWIMGSAKTHRSFLWTMAKSTGCRVVAVEYALAPENPYPEGLIDVISAYLALTRQSPSSASLPANLPVPPSRLVIAGDSAGGNLSLALLTFLRDRSLPLPAGAALLSPAAELTFSNPDYQLNRFDYLPWAPFKTVTVPEAAGGPAAGGAWTGLERVPAPERTEVGESEPGEDQVHLYCANHEIFQPYVSPLIYTGLEGLPPVLVQVGDQERIWGQGLGVALKIARQRASRGVRFESYINQVHVFQMFAFITAGHVGRVALARLASFINEVLAAAETDAAAGASAPNHSIPTEFLEVGLDGKLHAGVGEAAFKKRLASMCDKVRRYKGQRDPDKDNRLFARDKQIPRAQYIWEGIRLDWYEDAAKEGESKL